MNTLVKSMSMGYFLDKVRSLRKAKKMSQQDIAEMVGLSRENYNSFELGRRPLGKREDALAEALGVPLSQLKAWQRLEGASEQEMAYLHIELLQALGDTVSSELGSSLQIVGLDAVKQAISEEKKKRML